MTSYLLLRNNKESGPYSVDDLVKLGLKAYDLVWIQGKSAAWRYPSEVDELKSFAPQVEEQPFDRFYKKGTESKENETQTEKEPRNGTTKKQDNNYIAPEHEKYIPRKSVFVTMPGGEKTGTVQPVKKEIPVIQEKPQPVKDPVQQTITISENPNAAQVKYSQPLDDIKEMYVKTLYDRKQKIARKTYLAQNLKKAAIIAGLIAIGVVAGLVFRSGDNKKELASLKRETLPAQSTQQPTDIKTSLSTTENKPQQQNPNPNGEKSNSAAASLSEQTLPPPTGGFANKKAHEQHTIPTETDKSLDKPITGNSKKELVLSAPENDFTNDYASLDADPKTGERNKKIRGAGNPEHKNTDGKREDQRSYVSNEFGGLVTVASNNYKKVAFGGIRDLQLTVTNDSKYMLENVIVELQYIKPNELPLRTENIQFKSVASGESSTIKVPDTNRGVKVNYRIINIKSRQMDEGVAGN